MYHSLELGLNWSALWSIFNTSFILATTWSWLCNLCADYSCSSIQTFGPLLLLSFYSFLNFQVLPLNLNFSVFQYFLSPSFQKLTQIFFVVLKVQNLFFQFIQPLAEIYLFLTIKLCHVAQKRFLNFDREMVSTQLLTWQSLFLHLPLCLWKELCNSGKNKFQKMICTNFQQLPNKIRYKHYAS